MATLFFLRWAARVILLVYAVCWAGLIVLDALGVLDTIPPEPGAYFFATVIALLAVILLVVAWFFELAGGILLLLVAAAVLWIYAQQPGPKNNVDLYQLLALLTPLVLSGILLFLRRALARPKRAP